MNKSMNEKIILVDDDNHILTSVSLALRNEGWQVETYPDGEKGLIALQRNIPDLVILDIKMPRIDGMEMLKRLRISSNVPVIFLTSKDEEIDESSFSINLLIPIISNESKKDSNEFSILGGFFAIKTGEDAKIRILYIPIDL